MFENVAAYLEETCGVYYNREERFFICPECGEPIYADDWTDQDFETHLCPICEWDGE